MSTVIPIVQGTVIQDGGTYNDNNANEQLQITLPPNNNNNTTIEATAAINNPYNQYQAPPQPYPTINNRSSRSYRGFSTSICSMFSSFPRVDCCSLVFCGLLQWDYNYYLLTHEQPPSLWNRAFRHIFVPLFIFLGAAYCATRIGDQRTNELSVTILLILLVVYLIVDCMLERRKRIEFRKRLIDTLSSNSSPSNSIYNNHTTQQTTSDYCCALCGFYTCDDDNDFVVNESNNTDNNNDLCSILWQFFAALCCATCCRCWVQCCGVCATAQEGREIALYVGKEGTLIDYVTFEPFTDYFPNIAHLRFTKNNSLWEHYGALSNLSALMFRTLLISIIMLTVLAVLDYQDSFTWANLLVFVATFTQAFIILYFVHWKWNRFDLSLDAVIKYFASGFLISTTLAICFELIGSLVMNIFFNILALVTSTPNGDGNDANNNNMNEIFNWKSGVFSWRSGVLTKMKNYYNDMSGADDSDYSAGHFIIVVVYFLCTSFVIAALVEEMCKYYGFLVVDHPDMFQDCSIFLNGLVEDDDHEEEDGESSHESSSIKPKLQLNQNSSNDVFPDSTDIAADSPLSPPSPPLNTKRDLNSMGSAITVAMVTVAMGFACCENLVYIFIYTGGGAGMEVVTLIARSLFPVHPLCAAIQSINVCRRILEKDDSYGVGYTIFPSLLLHGAFDFSLMLTAFLASGQTNSATDDEGDNDDNESVGLLAFLFAFGIVLLGFIYYYVESHRQKKRLTALEISGSTMSFI